MSRCISVFLQVRYAPAQIRRDVIMASRRAQLEDLRDLLRAHLDVAPPSAVAGIAREYRATLAELEAMSPGGDAPREEGSKVDELAARREARRSAEAAD